MRDYRSLRDASLGPLCLKVGSGITPSGGASVYVDSGTALIRSQNVYNADFAHRGLAFLTDRTAEMMKGVSIEFGDILLNITGDSVARCCQVPDDVLPARVNQHVSIIRPDQSKLHPRFLMYFLVSPLMQATMLSLAGSGGTRKALTKTMIERFRVPLPDLSEQRKIAGLLSAYDDLIQNNRRRIALLEHAAREFYREWFVRLRFPGHESTLIVDGVTKEWEIVTLDRIGHLRYGKALKADDRIDGDYPVYGSSGVVGTHDTPHVMGPGIIVGRKGNVGSVYWSDSDFWAIDTVYYVEPSAVTLFLYYTLENMDFINTDVAVPGLNRNLAHSRKFLRPSVAVQEAFNEVAETEHKQIALLRKENNSLEYARDLLLPRLMSGEVAV